MDKDFKSEHMKEISCRVTRTLLMYIQETKNGALDDFLSGLPLDENYLTDTNNWVSHAFLHILYRRMVSLLGDENAVYNMALASGRFRSLGLLDRIARLLGSPKLIYSQAPKYNKFLKLNGSVFIHDIGDTWVVLEDRYHSSVQKTRYDCDYTRGILAGIPTMFGLPFAEVEEIECQVAKEKYGLRHWPDKPTHGAGACLYKVHWLPKKTPLLKRLFFRRTYHKQAIDDLVQANQLIQSKYDEVKRLATDLEKTNRELVESKRAMESQRVQLIESERKYRLLAENVSDTIWIFNLITLKFEYISPSVMQNRGFTPEEAKDHSLEQTLSPQSRTQIEEFLEIELSNDNKSGVIPQELRRFEIELSVKGGGYIWAETTVSVLRDPDGTPTAIMGVYRDISERIKAEEDKKKLTTQLLHSQKMEALGTLAGGVAHDFNNLLTVISGYSHELLKLKTENDREKTNLIAIQRAADRASKLVQQLLLFSRKAETERRTLDLNIEVDHAYKILGRTLPKMIDIRLGLDNDLWTINADPIQIEQVILNLGTNAADAMPEGGKLCIGTQNVVIDGESTDKPVNALPGRYVLLTVSDTGHGIDEGTIEQIFQPFYTTKEIGKGTGLGLSSVYGVIKNHGGYIECHSKIGWGSIFKAYLPAAENLTLADNVDAKIIQPQGGAETILMVDDESDIRALISQVFEEYGYNVYSAISGEEAIEIYSNRMNDIDLVLLDLSMPGMGGHRCLQELIKLNPDAKVIIASGYSSDGQLKKSLEYGALDYIGKPYKVTDLLNKIRIVLNDEQ